MKTSNYRVMRRLQTNWEALTPPPPKPEPLSSNTYSTGRSSVMRKITRRWRDDQTIIAPCSRCGRTGLVSGKSRHCVGLGRIKKCAETGRRNAAQFYPKETTA